MSLQPAEKIWVDKLATQAKLRSAVEKRRAQKDAILEDMAGEMAKAQDEILQKIKGLEASDGKNPMKVLDYLTRDQTTEFDLADQMSGYGLTPEAQKKLTEIGVALDLLAKKLDAKVQTVDPATGDETGDEEPLFSTADLKQDLYGPVVRQGLISETFVEDEYSDTAELLKGSFDAYKERLDEEGVVSEAKENFKLGLVIAKSAASIVASGIGLSDLDDKVSKWKPSMEFFEKVADGGPAEVAEYCAMGLEMLSMGVENIEQIVETVEGIEKDRAEQGGPAKAGDAESAKKVQARRAMMARKLAPQLTAAVASALGSGFSGAGWDLGVAAGSTFGSAVKPAALAKELAANPLTRAHVEQVRTLLAAGFDAAMAACDPGSAAADGLPASRDILQAAAQKMSSKFAAAFPVDDILARLQEEKFAEAITAAATAAAAAVVEGKTTSQLDALFGDAGRAQAAKATAGKKLGEEFTREMDADDRERDELARRIDEAVDEQRAGMLAKRIRAMEASEKLVGMAADLAGMGLSVASKFIAPLAIAGSALALARDVAKAAKRMLDWHNFYQSKLDMFQAASAYSAAVANFHYNARKQFAQHAINAALDFVNMVGAVAETGGLAAMGVGALVGKAAQGAASAAGALAEVLFELDKRWGLEKAWSVYRVALENPENRRLGLIALKENPTLAKYAVAWGAIVKNDPLVGDFLDRCGMTAEELQDPKSKVADVVKYLELRMPDDNTVVGREVVKSGWQPADSAIVLTAASWLAAKKLAEANAKLEVQATRDVEVALLDYAKVQATLDPLVSAKPDYERARAHLQEAVKAMAAWRPRRQGQTVEHSEMKALVGKFRDKAAAKLGELEREIARL